MPTTRYPNFEVTHSRDAWDAHTRDIVMARVNRAPEPQTSFLTPEEVETLHAIVAHLLYEDRHEIIDFVVEHFDSRLSGSPGESDRKATVPPAGTLIRQGLSAIDAAAKHRHWRRFVHCRTEQQFALLAELQLGGLEALPEWIGIPQKDLFKKLLSTAVDAYASHPKVWSEMGYAGPAYPRGYYRIERGVHDPWEPVAPDRGPAPRR